MFAFLPCVGYNSPYGAKRADFSCREEPDGKGEPMKMMKRFAALALALVLTMSIAACGGSESMSASASARDRKSTRLNSSH